MGRSTFAWWPRVPSIFAGEFCIYKFILLWLTRAREPGKLDVDKQALVLVVFSMTRVITQAMECLCKSLRRVYIMQRLNAVHQAAIAIIQEAGGSVASRSLLASERPDVNPFTLAPEVLMGREFLVVRAIPETQGETGRDAQLRLANEFYETVGNTSPMLQG